MSSQQRKPDFISQTAEPMSKVETYEWFRNCSSRMRNEGATWIQYSMDPNSSPTIYLVEGWKIRPAIQPNPEFQMVKCKAK